MTHSSHGAMRPSLPRSGKELAVRDVVPTSSAARDANGRFTSGADTDRAENRIRQLIVEGLGRDLPGDAGELARRAVRLYRAFCRDLPCLCSSVRSMAAQRARAATLADAYSRRGLELGVSTPEGIAMMELALEWDKRAERLAVTVLDQSTRFAAVARQRPQAGASVDVATIFGGGDP